MQKSPWQKAHIQSIFNTVQIRGWDWTLGCSCSHAIYSSESACPLPASKETPNHIISCSECTELVQRLEHLTVSTVCSAFKNIILHRCPLSVILYIGSVHSSNAQRWNTWGGIQTGKHLAQTESQQCCKKPFSAMLDSKARKNTISVI